MPSYREMKFSGRPHQEEKLITSNDASGTSRDCSDVGDRHLRTEIQRLVTAFAFALAIAGAMTPKVAEAGVLSSATRSAIARRAAASQPMAFGKRAFGKPRDVVIQRARHPQAAAHIEHAQKAGQPSILHIDRKGASARRPQAIGTVRRDRKPVSGYQRDEYPPAFTKEGGSGSSVQWIRQRDNAGAGSSMRWQTHDLPDGSKIRILVQ